MKYSKPVVLNASVVNGAKCGGGPCGRPTGSVRQRAIVNGAKCGGGPCGRPTGS